ncbi:MAG TPA: hypothetical protein PKX78_02670 [Candidatus Woesebacteria bacterium]|nr:hypothetical protein [Candidatus Woesebacteria bacterium]
MSNIQTIALLAFVFVNLLIFFKSWWEVVKKQNPFGLTPWMSWLGMFVWGDTLVIAPFWVLAVLVSTIVHDWILFFLIASIFWSVRSLGEMVYWLNEQFAAKKRNPPQTLMGYSLIKSEAIWFVYQVFWQCVLVFSIVSAIYFARIW